MYADTKLPVAFKTENRCQEKVTIIKRTGTVKKGFIECTDNTVSFATSLCRQSDPARSVLHSEEYVELKKQPTATHPTATNASLDFTFKFSTNVTSRRHGHRGHARGFFWKINLQLLGPNGPVSPMLSTTSHEFSLISRPHLPANRLPVLQECWSDGKPGDLVTCIGSNLQGKCVIGELGCEAWGHRTVVLQQVRASKQAFVTRLPATLSPGHYRVQFRCSESDTVSSCPLTVAPRPCGITNSAATATASSSASAVGSTGSALSTASGTVTSSCSSVQSRARHGYLTLDSQGNTQDLLFERQTSMPDTCLVLAHDGSLGSVLNNMSQAKSLSQEKACCSIGGGKMEIDEDISFIDDNLSTDSEYLSESLSRDELSEPWDLARDETHIGQSNATSGSFYEYA